MAYCVPFRRCVLDFCSSAGNSLREASRIFKISATTILHWKRLDSAGSLEVKRNRANRKLDLEALKFLLAQQPDQLQSEMAEYFGVGENTIRRGLKKIGYKRKKNNPIQREERTKKARICGCYKGNTS